MRKVLVAPALTAAFTGATAAPALAGPVPTSPCEIQELLGVDNVKECEAPDLG